MPSGSWAFERHSRGPHRFGGDQRIPEPIRWCVGQANRVRRVHELAAGGSARRLPRRSMRFTASSSSCTDPETAALFVDQGLVTALNDVPIDVETLNPLLVSAMTDLDEQVDYVVLPDVYIPTAVLTATERMTSLAYTPGTSAEDILEGLEAAYANQ